MAASLAVKDEDMQQASVPKFREAVYEKLWIIPDWNRIQQSREEVKAQSFEFSTGKSTGPQTKWQLGFKFTILRTADFYLNWKLVEAKGFPDEPLTIFTHAWILKQGSLELIGNRSDVITVGQHVPSAKKNLSFNSQKWVSESWLNSNGELTFKLTLVIMEPEVPSADLKTKLFHKASFAQVRENSASLLGDRASADLKIVTSDEKELFAHKLILKAQCPFFKTMFCSDFSESKTGVVNVKDVNGKTMGIFLHLFYTGELLQSWKDDDTIVGFTYAVGKYQLTNVLKYLDGVLGSRDEEESFQLDVQLLDLAKKLDLKTAEQELLERIQKTMCKVKSGAEFFDLYDWK